MAVRNLKALPPAPIQGLRGWLHFQVCVNWRDDSLQVPGKGAAAKHGCNAQQLRPSGKGAMRMACSIAN